MSHTIPTDSTTPTSIVTASSQGWLSTVSSAIIALAALILVVMQGMASLTSSKDKRPHSVYIASLHNFNAGSHQIVGTFDNSIAALDALQDAANSRFGDDPAIVLPRHYMVVEPDSKGRNITRGLELFPERVALVQKMTVRRSKL